MYNDAYKYCPRCATLLVEKCISHALRQSCPACGFIYFPEPKLVTVVVIEHEGKFLLGRRNIDPGKGLWSFVGGYVDRGEQVEEAAIREVREETNLAVRLDELLGIYSENGRPHVVVAYRARVVNNDVSGMLAQLDEVSELAFFVLGEMPVLAFPADKHILQALHSR